VCSPSIGAKLRSSEGVAAKRQRIRRERRGNPAVTDRAAAALESAARLATTRWNIPARSVEVLFDCFGDFEGFVLDSCAKAIPFRSRERGIAEIILRACRERLLVAVFVERKPPHKICQIVVRC